MEHGSISCAAKRLGVSRSTIHQRLAKRDAHALLEQVREGVPIEVVAHLAATVRRCLDTVSQLLSDQDPRVRLRAASRLLSIVGGGEAPRPRRVTEATTPVARALDLARAQSSDEEIEAAVAAEFGTRLDFDAHHSEIAGARFYGQALLREQPFHDDSPAVASWLSRQHLGMSARGLDAEVREQAMRLAKLTPAQLAGRLRNEADELETKNSTARTATP